MKIFARRILTVAVMLVVSCKARNNSSTKDYDVPSKTSTKLGYSYNLINNSQIDNECVEFKKDTPETKEVSNNTKDFTLELVENNSALISAFTLKAGVSLTGFFGNGKGEFEWLSNNSVNSFNTYLIMRSVHNFTGLSASNFKLVESVKSELGDAKLDALRTFRAHCGDAYVKSISRMAYFFGFIKIDTKTADEREEFKIALSGETKNLPVQGSANANVLRTIANKAGNKAVNVRIFEGGADREIGVGDNMGKIESLIDEFNKFQSFLKANSEKEKIGVNTVATLDDYSTALNTGKEATIPLIELGKRVGFLRWKLEELDRAVNNLLGRKADLEFAKENPNSVDITSFEEGNAKIMRNMSPTDKIQAVKDTAQEIDKRVKALRDLRREVRDTFESDPTRFPSAEVPPANKAAALPQAMVQQSPVQKVVQALDDLKGEKFTEVSPIGHVSFIKIPSNSLFFSAGWAASPPNKNIKNDFTVGFDATNISSDSKFICTVELRPSQDATVVGTGNPILERFELEPNGSKPRLTFSKTATFEVKRVDIKIECSSLQNPNLRQSITHSVLYK